MQLILKWIKQLVKEKFVEKGKDVEQKRSVEEREKKQGDDTNII